MTPGDLHPIVRIHRGAVAALAVFGFFYPIGFRLDSTDGVPIVAAVVLLAGEFLLLWRSLLVGVYTDGSDVVVINLTRSRRVDARSVVGIGPPEREMGRLYLLIAPDHQEVRMSVSAQGGKARERMRGQIRKAVDAVQGDPLPQ